MNMQQDIEEEASGNLFAALPAILWQRRWLLVPPVVLCAAAGVAAAFLLPAEYESSATVLIESAQLPTEGQNQYVDVISERIARARERVLSRQDLIRSIRANDLYPKEQESKPLSEVVERMRKATSIQAVGIDDGNGLHAAQGNNTIALRMSFRYEDPVKAQLVAQQYVNRFLEVDAAATAESAQGARSFLQEQANQLRNQLTTVENQVTKMKADNGAVLAMQERATGDPTADAARIDSEIASLEAQNVQLAATARTGGGGDGSVAQAQAMLRILRAKYSDDHPDVKAAEAQLEAARAAAGKDSGGAAGVNPQIVANRAQIQALRVAKGIMLSNSAAQRSAAARGPAIAGQVDQLEKQADTLRSQYAMLTSRLQGAQMSARMETEQKGERLTLSDPPVVPDTPVWPNRPMLIVAAVAAGAGIGLALVFLVELLLRPIRGVDALRGITGSAPLALVPDYRLRPNLVIRWLERRHRRKAARAA